MKINDNELFLEKLKLKAIGWVETDKTDMPRHWTISNVIGKLVIQPEYKEGLEGICTGKRIQVVFIFHKSPPFTQSLLRQTPPHSGIEKGVFCTCSPKRPNPIGVSVLEVLDVQETVITVKGLDMLDDTPILDIKPYTEKK